MSIIAYDGKTIAADRQAVSSDMRGTMTKLRRLQSGEIMAWAGTQDHGLTLVRWYQEGAKREHYPAFQRDKEHWTRLIVAIRAHVLSFEMEPEAIELEDPFMAWGSGRDFAMGALAMGATAKEAVEIAIRFCIWCGMGVDVMEIA